MKAKNSPVSGISQFVQSSHQQQLAIAKKQ